jgi:hypothetical protein
MNDYACASISNTGQCRKSFNHPSLMKELVPGGRSGAAQRRGSFGTTSYLNNEFFLADPTWNRSEIAQVAAPTTTHVVVECPPQGQRNEWSPLSWQNVQAVDRSSQSLFSHDWLLGDDHELSQASITLIDHGSGQSKKHQDNGRSNFLSTENGYDGDLARYERHPKEFKETSTREKELQNKAKIRKSRSTNALLVDDEEVRRQRRSKWNGSNDDSDMKPAHRRIHSNPALLSDVDLNQSDNFRQSADKNADGGTIRKSKSTNALLLDDKEAMRQRRSRRTGFDDDVDVKLAHRRSHSNPRLFDVDDDFRQSADKKVDGGTIRKSKSTNAFLLDNKEAMRQRRSRRTGSDDDVDVKLAHRRSHSKSRLFETEIHQCRQSGNDEDSGGIRKSSNAKALLVDDADAKRQVRSRRNASNDDSDTKPAHRRSHSNPHLSGDKYLIDCDYFQRTRNEKNNGDDIRRTSSTDVSIFDGAGAKDVNETSKKSVAGRSQSNLKLADQAASRCDDSRANHNKKKK